MVAFSTMLIIGGVGVALLAQRGVGSKFFSLTIPKKSFFHGFQEFYLTFLTNQIKPEWPIEKLKKAEIVEE
ncbi:hypothetical protein BpHYR1_032001 [Brachionus plicatilis]|uniref:Uncharacterized protein n=1 Tax=Brachionus plicatilis TaxID=10195 RepID=A0A3M7SG11_BRAPC|nr:hypothetical protein BpHYR1_032001 [Brachionus plicatilis]